MNPNSAPTRPMHKLSLHAWPLSLAGLRSPVLLWALLVLLALLLPRVAAAQASMFSDPKAREAGDVLTVILAERTAAQRESGWQNASSSSADGGTDAKSGDLAGKFAFDANLGRSARSLNESVQSDLLSGTLTAVIVGVDEAGNLQVEGERKLSVNGEAHLMRISGVVRPFDVRYDNTILSYQIANADIEYRRDGFGRKWVKPGFLVRTGTLALLGIGIAAVL